MASRRRRKRLQRRLSRLILLCAVGIIGFFLVRLIIGSVSGDEKTGTIISPLAASIGVIKGIASPSELDEVVIKSLTGTQGTYAVAIKNLKTGESFYMNETRKFDSASLYKLWVMAEVYRQVESGKLSLDKEIKRDIADINERFDLATESAELTEGDFDMSVKSAVNQMITISHNYAALSLVLEVGLSNVQKLVEAQGFVNSSTGSPPSTTAQDIASYYEKLYAGELGNPESTAAMLDTLKKQQLNDRIPKYLPEGTQVAHKTGELGKVKHDAGIVYTPFGDYVIVILSESNSPQCAAEREAELSKAVYEYFQKQ